MMTRLICLVLFLALLLAGAELHSPRLKPVALAQRTKPRVWRVGVALGRVGVEFRIVRL
jgi:hypothetical protein